MRVGGARSSFALDNQPSSSSTTDAPELRVLVVTNLWPYEGDPSYGCFVRDQMESLRPLGVAYDVLFINGRESRGNYVRSVFSLRRMLRARRYDLVHAHMGLAGLAARCQLRVPLVVSFLGNDVMGRFSRPGRRTLYDGFFRVSSFVLARLAREVIVQSEEMRTKLGLARARVISNGIDMNVFRPLDRVQACRGLGLDPRKKYVLFPYHPAQTWKRFDLVEVAVKQAREQVPELELLTVSRHPRAEVPRWMAAADCLVHASEVEGSPNTVKEALAMNLPVVTVKVGDTPELLGGVEGCFLVPRDPKAMADAIVEVVRRGGRIRGRESVGRFSMENVARRVFEVYLAALGRTAAAPAGSAETKPTTT